MNTKRCTTDAPPPPELCDECKGKQKIERVCCKCGTPIKSEDYKDLEKQWNSAKTVTEAGGKAIKG